MKCYVAIGTVAVVFLAEDDKEAKWRAGHWLEEELGNNDFQDGTVDVCRATKAKVSRVGWSGGDLVYGIQREDITVAEALKEDEA